METYIALVLPHPNRDSHGRPVLAALVLLAALQILHQR